MSDRHLHDDSAPQDWQGGAELTQPARGEVRTWTKPASQTAQEAPREDFGSRAAQDAYRRLERAMGQPWRPGHDELETVYLAVLQEAGMRGLGHVEAVRLAEAVRTRLKDAR